MGLQKQMISQFNEIQIANKSVIWIWQICLIKWIDLTCQSYAHDMSFIIELASYNIKFTSYDTFEILINI